MKTQTYYSINLKIGSSDDRFEYCGYDGSKLIYNPRQQLWTTSSRKTAIEECKMIQETEIEYGVLAEVVKHEVEI